RCVPPAAWAGPRWPAAATRRPAPAQGQPYGPPVAGNVELSTTVVAAKLMFGETHRPSRGDNMPAVTVPDLLVLPRVPEPDPAAVVERPVLSVTTAPSGFEGEGFPVRRAFAGVDLARLDPFIHMDQMGEVDYAPGEPKGTAWHPHRGF